MARIIESWESGKIKIAVECTKDEANREYPHVHIYKNGRRTSDRIPGREPRDISESEADEAYRLYSQHKNEIERIFEDAKRGMYGD